MNKLNSQTEPLLRHLGTGAAAGLFLLLIWGFLNALLVMGGTAVWFKQFILGAPVPPGAKAYLLKTFPIFAISAASHGLLGLLAGGLWGAILWGWLKARSRFLEDSLSLVSFHTASFVAVPLFLFPTLTFTLMSDKLGQGDSPGYVLKVILVALALGLASVVIYKISLFFTRLLLRIPPCRLLTRGKWFWGLTLGYGLVICLVSFLPPAWVSSGDTNITPALPTGSEDRTGLPNILLVVMDTTRSDHLSCYGYPKPTTPFLDQLAGEGVVFEHAYSPAVWTLPGHAAIFTGMTASKNGANGEHLYLDESFTTLAEILNNHGYRTGGFSNNPWVSGFTGMTQGFGEYRKMWLKRYATNFLVSFAIYQGIKAIFTEVAPIGGVVTTTQEARAWIMKDSDKPFFAFINLMEPHPPLDYRPDYTPPFLPHGIGREETEGINQDPYRIWAGKGELSQDDSTAYAGLYDGEIRYMDFHLGKFFEQLRQDQVLDRTVLIITADHGEQIGEQGYLGHHFSLREALIHVPLIIRYPEAFPRGVRVHEKVQTMDILPTILSLLDIDDQDLWDPLLGQSLYPLPRRERSTIIAEEFRSFLEMKFVKAYQPDFDVDEVYGHRKTACIHDSYKYIFSDNGEESLYHLGQDARETRNLVSALPEILESLRGLLVQWAGTFEPYQLKSEEFDFQPDPATEEQLRSLGYIQ